MRKHHSGFTLIEVAIFLAITGLLFVGIVFGVQNSLNQQRYTDAAQNFMEFLRSAYSQVANVQRPVVAGSDVTVGSGQSDKAAYGKMITFGEEFDLEGKENSNHEIFMYTLVGNVASAGTGRTLDLISSLNSNVIFKKNDVIGYYETIESYTPRWGAEIQPDCYDEESCFEPLRGTLLIARHPTSGNIMTYYSDTVIEVNKAVKNNSLDVFGPSGLSSLFNIEQVDFCVNASEDLTKTDARFDIRIVKNAHNASGIETISEDTAEGVAEGTNKCKGK